MKARIPKHREFVIQFPENYEKSEECWGKLQQIMNDYKKQGKSVYTESFMKNKKKKVKGWQKISNLPNPTDVREKKPSPPCGISAWAIWLL